MRRLVRATKWIEGIGLHHGELTAVRILPGSDHVAARAVGGIVFRTLGDDRLIGVSPDRVDSHASRHTVLVSDRTTISTIEHLLSALVGLGIFDAVVEVRGGELPALDGSAKPFVTALVAASVRETVEPTDSSAWVVTQTMSLRSGSSTCMLRPAERLTVRCEIDFPHPLVGAQRLAFEQDEQRYIDEIAPARTFGFIEEAEQLRRAGLALGASLSCAVVFGDDREVLNPEGLRFDDEPVRHKVLDAIGDLGLLGAPLKGELVLQRCGHQLLHELLRRAIRSNALRLTGAPPCC